LKWAMAEKVEELRKEETQAPVASEVDHTA
jgi:hypothetical protein